MIGEGWFGAAIDHKIKSPREVSRHEHDHGRKSHDPERLLWHLPADPGAEIRRDQLRSRGAETHRSEPGLQSVSDDGARTKVRRQRNGARHLPASQSL